MKNKLKEWFSIQLVKNPGRMVLAAILVFNVFFLLLSAIVISSLSLEGTEKMSFIEAAFCTVTMILDAGCIQFVVADIGHSGVLLTVFCLLVILVGMISFTGAVIGYVTNYISNFIENANAGKRKLNLAGHFVILNWNSRASEIVNDMLYGETRRNVVVLVQARKNEVLKEIEERLEDTVARENKIVIERYRHLPFFARFAAIRKNRFKNKLNVIVREGDVFSSKQLADISLDKAKSIIILGNDINNTVCRMEQRERLEESGKGNSQTLKTVMQVSDITSAASSADNQKIIVEITDPWTLDLVNKVIQAKQVEGKCNIVPVKVNEVLGQILSQFCLMPELNSVYSELFSERGAEFYSKEIEPCDEETFISEYLSRHNNALPVTATYSGDKFYGYYVANDEKDISKETKVISSGYTVSLNKNYWIERKNVIILGHNSRSNNIMLGFRAFSNEWKRGGEDIVRIIVVDDKKSLEKMNYYRDYDFVIETVEADVYDKELICSTINRFVASNKEDTSVLILSDDTAIAEDIDSGALANLVYVRDIIDGKIKENPNFDPESIDVIVEIIDPKHHDIVNSYSVNNVVISNRYISKMITQISEIEALFDFYSDILSYDDATGGTEYSSKEVYIKKVDRYFDRLPEATTADKFVRAVYEASLDPSVFGFVDPTIALGYVKPGGKVVVFGGDLSKIPVKLEHGDKLILFAAH